MYRTVSLADRVWPEGVVNRRQCYASGRNQRQLGSVISGKRLNVACQMAPQDQTVDVAVVGAGPGGLACAAAIMTALGPEARVKVDILCFVAQSKETVQSYVATACYTGI